MSKGSKICIPKMTDTPKYDIRTPKTNTNIQFMQVHALTDKFIGLWISQKSLIKWIDLKWNSKLKINLK